LKLGIDQLLSSPQNFLSDCRVGLLAHQASLSSEGQSTLKSLQGICDLKALFGPEHGVATQAQDMEAVAASTDSGSKLPVFSLYGDSFVSLSPTPEMLDLIDVLVVDLQDIGSRYYTYVWTTVLAMQACAKQGKSVIICDRPNPLGGVVTEGPGIEAGFESFVGLYSIPVRHGMTIGEICTLLNDRQKIGCSLEVISMEGWDRAMHWPETGLQWVNPSPNMRSYQAALLYPGMCLLEATNASEGRGADTPFEVMGAPYIRSDELLEKFLSLELPGISAEPCTFTPSFQKHAGQVCNGLKWQVTDRESFRPYLSGLALTWALYQLYDGKGFAWRSEPYEFVADIPAIDLLTGSDQFRKRITTRDFNELACPTKL